MTQSRKIAIVFLGLLVAGAVRAPLELALTRDLRGKGLLPEPLEISAREEIGQTGFAVALGGLRTLVATFYNLRAYTAFTENRWLDAEKSFETTVALAPTTSYYWTNGGWQLAYNASHYHHADQSQPPLRRQELWRSSILKGRAFMERGIRNNPDSWPIKAELGRLMTDANKVPAFTGPDGVPLPQHYEKAAAIYRAASEAGAPAYTRRMWYYCLARIPGKEAEALEMGEALAQSRIHRTPTGMALLFVLRMYANPEQDASALAAELFADDQQAYRSLSFLWQDRREHYPVHGLARILGILEQRLGIPPEQSILNSR